MIYLVYNIIYLVVLFDEWGKYKKKNEKIKREDDEIDFVCGERGVFYFK